MSANFRKGFKFTTKSTQMAPEVMINFEDIEQESTVKQYKHDNNAVGDSENLQSQKRSSEMSGKSERF